MDILTNLHLTKKTIPATNNLEKETVSGLILHMQNTELPTSAECLNNTFKQYHTLQNIFNKKRIKKSYSCMIIMKNVMGAQNKRVLQQSQNEAEQKVNTKTQVSKKE